MNYIMNNTNGGGGDGGGCNGVDNSTDANREGVNFNYAYGRGPSSCNGQMNPVAFTSQFSGMMSDISNNPQNFSSTAEKEENLMSMMGSFCPTANSGGVGGNMIPFSPPGNDCLDSQGMSLAMVQMMRKRPNEDVGDEQPAKRGNFGSSGASDGNEKLFVPPSKEAKEGNENPSASSPAPRKEHIVFPPSKEGIKFYSRNDVLSGRGGGTNVHPGNSRFRDLINANRRTYLKARKNDKPAISRALVRTIREMNGRFLKKDEKLGLWFEIGDAAAREKTSQALRQRAPEMRKLLFEEEQRQRQQQMMMMMQQLQHPMGKGGMGEQGHSEGAFSQMGPVGRRIQNSGGAFTQMESMGGMGGDFAASSTGGGNQGAPNAGKVNNEVSPSLSTNYNIPHQMNWFSQDKNMILQRLATSGLNPQSLSSTQNNFDNMMTQTLLQQGMKPFTPRGA